VERQPINDSDFKPRTRSPILSGMKSKHMRWLLPASCLAAVLALFMSMPNSSQATRTPPAAARDAIANSQDPATTLTMPLPLPDKAAQPGDDAVATGAPAFDDGGRWQTITIRRGDNLSDIFSRSGASAADLQSVMHAGADAKQLRSLYPGDTLRLELDGNGNLLALDYEMDRTHSLKVTKDNDGFHVKAVERRTETRIAHAGAVVDSSLYLAGKDAGLPDRLIMELADIFGWDIDFALDIRSGDSFTVLYEQQYLNGEKVDDGDIIAAEFVNQGTAYRAVRYTAPDGRVDYYSPDGKSMRKAFLRTPVEFTRISSYFNLHRRHPILNRIRAHKGVDYAAPTGTPVRATGDGKVIWRGRKGGYGNVIMLQHGPKYQTVYAHLSRYARSVHAGGYVKQGQVIGYVGMTGLATGPHLHYEFHVNGVYRNPLTVKLPEAAPIAARYKADFMTRSRPLLAQLDILDKTVVVLNEEN
jgi:murein DD-endopeptidase MepM/ murein hydrolase activator NlpD